jgi:hypothetical protein
VARLRLSEKWISGEIASWIDVALPQMIAERDQAKGKALAEIDCKISIINHKLERLRREQRAAVSALLSAEGDIVKLEKSRGALISLDAAKDLVSQALLPVIIAIKRMPESAEDVRERARLSALAEALLSTLRDSAHEVVKEKTPSAEVATAGA